MLTAAPPVPELGRSPKKRSPMRICQISLLIAFLASSGCIGIHRPSPLASALASHEALKIDFTSRGCFHRDHYELTLVPTSNGVQVTGLDRSRYWDEALKKPVEDGQRPLSPITLSSSDLLKLDCLFEFYRSKPAGGCTTIDEITLRKLSAGSTVQTEVFTDASCDTYDRRDFLTVGQLVRRMEPPKTPR